MRDSLCNNAHSVFSASEGMDVYRIGQTGIPHAHEPRLYIYAEIKGEEIQLLTIGDKKTQPQDIAKCHAKAHEFRKQKEEANGQKSG